MPPWRLTWSNSVFYTNWFKKINNCKINQLLNVMSVTRMNINEHKDYFYGIMRF